MQPPSSTALEENTRVRPFPLHSAGKGSNSSKDTGAQMKHSPGNLPWLQNCFHNHATPLPNASTVRPAWAQVVFVGLPCPV